MIVGIASSKAINMISKSLEDTGRRSMQQWVSMLNQGKNIGQCEPCPLTSRFLVRCFPGIQSKADDGCNPCVSLYCRCLSVSSSYHGASQNCISRWILRDYNKRPPVAAENIAIDLWEV